MNNTTIIVKAEVNGNVYRSEVDRYIGTEEYEQIASCKRHIRKMLNEDGLTDVSPDFIIEKKV
ncbi:MAG: hypothetical protein IJ887_00085 [Prevotella sp.]|nr:hypothetical protein [Prevotella sp.]